MKENNENTRLEYLLLHKTFEELNREEAAYALRECGSPGDYSRMRSLVLSLHEGSHKDDKLIPPAAMKEKLMARAGAANGKTPVRYYISAAAAILLLLLGGWYFYSYYNSIINGPKPVAAGGPAKVQDTVPEVAPEPKQLAEESKNEQPREHDIDSRSGKKPLASAGKAESPGQDRSGATYQWSFGDGNASTPESRDGISGVDTGIQPGSKLAQKNETAQGRSLADDPELLGLLFTAR